MNDYLKSLNPKRESQIVEELLKQAKNLKIPIITEEGINFLIQLIKIGKVKKILEIGSAIGYSSILMALNTNCEIITIEKDEANYKLALENIKKAGLKSRIQLIFADALEYDGLKEYDLDMIFIDAAKAQYIKFFEKYEVFLKQNGFVVTDNLLFHGEIENIDPNLNRSRRQLLKKIRNYNEYITSKEGYDSYIYEIGDGISVSIKK